MSPIFEESNKKDMIATLTDNLPVFRAKLNATQETFAMRIGLTKTSLNHIENHKKEMTWTTFVAIILLLMKNEDTKPLVEVMGLYPEELKNFLMFQE